MLRRLCRRRIDLNRRKIRRSCSHAGFIRNQAATRFLLLSGTDHSFPYGFLVTTQFGGEVGALGRLAMIFVVINNLLTNIFVPAFARCQESRKLRWQYAAIVGGVGGFSLLVTFAAAVFPNAFLFVLGNKYAHLQRELLLMVGASVLSALTGTFWALNASKAWITGSWLYIPLTLAAQLMLIPYTDFSSVSSVLIFNLLSAVPNLLLNLVLSYRGFRGLRFSTT